MAGSQYANVRGNGLNRMRMLRKSGTEKVKSNSIIVSVLMLWLWTAPAAFSQQAGVLEGRLIDGTDPSIPTAGVALEVVSLDGGMSIIRTAETDSSGTFRIDDLPTSSMLMLRAIYKGVHYNRQFRFDQAGNARLELTVYESTTSENTIHAEETQLIFRAIGDQIQSLETTILVNNTDPPRTFMNPSGNFLFSKSPGIEAVPQMRISGPDTTMPVVQSPLESPDGKTYYTLYPLKPGKTTIDVFQLLPYSNREYTYIKKFHYGVPSIEIAVTPIDTDFSGEGLTRIRTDTEQNIAVYRSDAIEAGTEVTWTFSGGTPLVEQESRPAASGSQIRTETNTIERNAGIIAPIILLGFILVLWYAISRKDANSSANGSSRKRKLKERQKFLLNRLVELDRQFEEHSIGLKEYRKHQEEAKRMLHRISFLLKPRSRGE